MSKENTEFSAFNTALKSNDFQKMLNALLSIDDLQCRFFKIDLEEHPSLLLRLTQSKPVLSLNSSTQKRNIYFFVINCFGASNQFKNIKKLLDTLNVLENKDRQLTKTEIAKQVEDLDKNNNTQLASTRAFLKLFLLNDNISAATIEKDFFQFTRGSWRSKYTVTITYKDISLDFLRILKFNGAFFQSKLGNNFSNFLEALFANQNINIVSYLLNTISLSDIKELLNSKKNSFSNDCSNLLKFYTLKNNNNYGYVQNKKQFKVDGIDIPESILSKSYVLSNGVNIIFVLKFLDKNNFPQQFNSVVAHLATNQKLDLIKTEIESSNGKQLINQLKLRLLSQLIFSDYIAIKFNKTEGLQVGGVKFPLDVLKGEPQDFNVQAFCNKLSSNLLMLAQCCYEKNAIPMAVKIIECSLKGEQDLQGLDENFSILCKLIYLKTVFNGNAVLAEDGETIKLEGIQIKLANFALEVEKAQIAPSALVKKLGLEIFNVILERNQNKLYSPAYLKQQPEEFSVILVGYVSLELYKPLKNLTANMDAKSLQDVVAKIKGNNEAEINASHYLNLVCCVKLFCAESKKHNSWITRILQNNNPNKYEYISQLKITLTLLLEKLEAKVMLGLFEAKSFISPFSGETLYNFVNQLKDSSLKRKFSTIILGSQFIHSTFDKDVKQWKSKFTDEQLNQLKNYKGSSSKVIVEEQGGSGSSEKHGTVESNDNSNSVSNDVGAPPPPPPPSFSLP